MKVEVIVLRSLSLIVLDMVSVDVKQHLRKKKKKKKKKKKEEAEEEGEEEEEEEEDSKLGKICCLYSILIDRTGDVSSILCPFK